MLVPVTVLAILAIVGGFIGFATNHPAALETFLATSDVTSPNDALSHGFHFSLAVVLSMVGAFAGVATAVLLYRAMPTGWEVPGKFSPSRFM